jgi:hypothetical protein
MSAQSSLSVQTSSFVVQWNHKTARFPVLNLDYNWPSIGVLGLLAGVIAGKEERTREEDSFVDILAWYLGLSIQSYWKIANIESELSFTNDGVELSLVSDKSLTAKLTLITAALLKELPLPLPVLTTYQRELPVSFDLFSPVALGIALGESPLMEGVVEGETNSLCDKGDQIVKSICRATAQFYERCFPNESLGQMAELYLASQIFPPLGMNETWPCLTSVTELLKFTSELKVSKGMLLSFAENLLTLPNEHLSHTGLAIYGALAGDKISDKALSHYESRRTLLGFLRHSMVEVKHLVGETDDWLNAEAPTEKEHRQYLQEIDLGFLPWFCMGDFILNEKAKDPKVNRLLKSLSNFDFAGAEGAADSIVENDPQNIEVRLQRIKLHLVAGELQQAELALRMLASEPDAEEDARLFLLWTQLDLRLSQLVEAQRHFDSAITLSAGDKRLRLKIFNELAPDFIFAGDVAFIMPYFETVRENGSFMFLLNKYRLLRTIGESEESQKILLRLADLCPLNTEIFYNFFLK